MNVKPLGSFVLIKKELDEEIVSTGGIILRAGVRYTGSVNATVVAFGPKCGMYKLVVGDRVLLHESAGALVKIDEVDHHIVREVDLKAKYVEDDSEVLKFYK